MMFAMAPTVTTTDVFGAMAEPHRRQLVELLAGGERSVSDLVAQTGLTQPQVSKHLRILREVGVVAAREEGRRRLYALNGPALTPMRDWVAGVEALWNERYEALDAVLEDLKKETGDAGDQ